VPTASAERHSSRLGAAALVGLTVALCLAPAIMGAVSASSVKGVPRSDALVAAAMATIPVAILAGVTTFVWMTRYRVAAVLGLAVMAALLWWIFALAAPSYGSFYDSVDPHPDACRDIPENMLCL
jgi:hypothetical protein